jgi:hypothetical protein
MDEQRSCLLFSQQQLTMILCNLLHRSVYEGIHHYWQYAKQNPHPEGGVYHTFRAKLEMIPTWNSAVIDREYQRIIHKTKCNYLDQLIRKIFIYNTQLLAAADPVDRSVRVPVPRGERFIHSVYVTVARSLFESFWLMEDRPDRIGSVDQAKNLAKTYRLICQCIEDTIREMLPIDEIVSMKMEEKWDPFMQPNPQHDNLRKIESLYNYQSQSEPVAPVAPVAPLSPLMLPLPNTSQTEEQEENMGSEDEQKKEGDEDEEDKEDDAASVVSDVSSNAASSMADAIEKVIFMGSENTDLAPKPYEKVHVDKSVSDVSSESDVGHGELPVQVKDPVDSTNVDLPDETIDFNPSRPPVPPKAPKSYYQSLMGILNHKKELAQKSQQDTESNFFDDTNTEFAFQ